jgi:hypothetical protein
MDHLIPPREHRRRDREAQGLGGSCVDDDLELRGLLDGQVGGPGALEDLCTVSRSLALSARAGGGRC